jgi:peptidoglycan/xylan/chitin deacetylase (PgdA/CDA1 family)
VSRRADVQASETTERVPILMYHRIADDGPADLARYRTPLEAFAEQMRWLRHNGYHAIGAAELARQLEWGRPLAGRPVVVSFDDGYRDFHDAAWPVLRANDFTADVMLVTDRIGGAADWDVQYGPPAPLMDWPEIRRLAAAGVRFGSHLATHRYASTMTSREIAREAAGSRTLIERAVGRPCLSLAAPFGDGDGRLVPIARRCGYTAALTTDPGHVRLGHDPMRLPRIEVLGGWSLQAFASAVRPAT